MSAEYLAPGSKVDVFGHYEQMYMVNGGELVALTDEAATVRYVYGGKERAETFPLYSRTLVDWQRPERGVRVSPAYTVEAAGSDVAGSHRLISIV